MPVVSELVAHILAHVNAEDDADPADESHVANFGRRAQLVRDAAASLRADGSDVTLRAFLTTLSDLVPGGPDRTSLRRALENMKGEGEPRPQLAIQEWVGKGQEGSLDG